MRLLASMSAETTVFMLTDAWGKRDVGTALAAVESLLERAGSRELPRLAALLANHVARVRACQALAEEGVRPRDAAGRLKMHPFAAEKAFAQAGELLARRARARRSCAWPSSTSRSRAAAGSRASSSSSARSSR